MQGTVKFSHNKKRYGFIESDDEDEVSFPESELEGEEIEEGTDVEFDTEESYKGPPSGRRKRGLGKRFQISFFLLFSSKTKTVFHHSLPRSRQSAGWCSGLSSHVREPRVLLKRTGIEKASDPKIPRGIF